MNAPAQPTAPPVPTGRRLGRRIAVSVILGMFVFLGLWVMVFSFVTSVLIGFASCFVVIAASETLNAVEMVVEAIATVIFGILAAIVAVIAAVFSIFG